MSFEMKVDRWLVAPLLVVAVGSVALGIRELTRGHQLTAGIAIGSIAFLGLLLRLIAWPVRYEIDDSGLSIHAGAQTLRLPFADIDGAERTRNAWSSVAAWSIDRVRIDFRAHDKPDSILISPALPEAFLAALAERAPHLETNGRPRDLRL